MHVKWGRWDVRSTHAAVVGAHSLCSFACHARDTRTLEVLRSTAGGVLGVLGVLGVPRTLVAVSSRLVVPLLGVTRELFRHALGQLT